MVIASVHGMLARHGERGKHMSDTIDLLEPIGSHVAPRPAPAASLPG